MFDPMAIAQGIFEIAVKIKQQIDLAKSNKSQFATLNSRVQEIVQSIKALDTLPRTDSYYQGLTRLKDTLAAILVFIEKFSHKTKWYQQVLQAGNHRAEFDEYNTALKEAIEQLNLGINVQQLMNAEQDKKDQVADNQAIQGMQAEILKLQQEEKALLLDMEMTAAQRHAVLEKQMQSLQRNLLHLVKQPADHKKSEFETHLKIPFGELEIHRIVGEGSFGTIYYAKHAGRSVAVKMISLDVSGHSEEFKREVQIMNRLRSSHTTQLFGYCQEPDATCLIMEYMEQGDLFQLLAKKVFTPEQQKQLILDIAQGLQYLHSQGIIHRDLKSANVLINRDNHAKIADFGLSKIQAITIASARQRSEALQWMAPEVRHLNPLYSQASDVYSFGVIVWEILTGQSPYNARQNPKASLASLEGKQPGALDKQLPTVYRDVIQACWAKEPADRPSLDDIIRQVEAFDPRPASPDGEAYFEQAKRYEKDKAYSEAYRAYDKAAQKGIWSAHTSCALFTLQGGLGGAPTDKLDAKRRLEVAAEHGHQRGMYNLARMYEKADGVSKDLEQALHWYKEASKFDEKLQLTQDAKGKVTAIEALSQATVVLRR